MLLRLVARRMFEEALGHVRAVPKHGLPAPLINELYVNAAAAIKTLWDERGYDPKFPEQIKARLGYALDRIEAVAYIVTASLHLPLLSSEEARRSACACILRNGTGCGYTIMSGGRVRNVKPLSIGHILEI